MFTCVNDTTKNICLLVLKRILKYMFSCISEGGLGGLGGCKLVNLGI